MTGIAERLTPEAGLSAGLRWLYLIVQPDNALVERRGAQLLVTGRRLRFLPISITGTPLIVVDTDTVRWGPGAMGPFLNTLPADELPSLAEQLAAFGIPTSQQHHHGVTGTIVLDAPAHPPLRAAIDRHARGCPYHHSLVCDAPIRDGGQSCRWRAEGRRAAIWPDGSGKQGDWR